MQNKLKELENKHKVTLAHDTLREIENIKSIINDLAAQEINKKLMFMFLKQRHYESGSNSSKIQAWKLKKKIA